LADAVKVFLLTLSALFPIVDPLAGSPIFLAMTQEYSPETRKALAWRVAINSFLLMVGSSIWANQACRDNPRAMAAITLGFRGSSKSQASAVAPGSPGKKFARRTSVDWPCSSA